MMLSRSYQAVWHDKRKKVCSIDLARVSGVILNTMSTMQVGFLKIPIRRRHWVAIQVILYKLYNIIIFIIGYKWRILES